MKKLLFIPLSLSIVLVQAQSLSRKAVFTKGQQLERVAVIKMNFGMEMMGQNIDMSNNNTITSLVEVKTATAKDYALASTVKRVVATMSGMGQEMAYDSDNKDASTAGDVGKKMGEVVGKTNNIMVDAKGMITASDDTTNTLAGNSEGFMGMTGGLVNAGNKPGNVYDLVANLPEKILKVGDTWTDSTNNKEGKVVTSYKVLEINGNEATVSMDATVTQSGEFENNGMTINMNMQGTSKGQYALEVATGLIRKRTANLDATGTMEVAGQSIPFTMKMTMEEGVAKK